MVLLLFLFTVENEQKTDTVKTADKKDVTYLVIPPPPPPPPPPRSKRW